MIFTDFYLCIYDIHDSKRLRNMVKRLEQINSMRIQKSVFEIQGNRTEILSFIKDIENIVDIETDKVAIIPLCSEDYEKVEFYGVLSKQPERPKSYYIL